jgi:hypothetical protein
MSPQQVDSPFAYEFQGSPQSSPSSSVSGRHIPHFFTSKMLSKIIFLAVSVSIAAAQTYKASFTEYGSGDSNGSPNCNTATTACGFYTSPGYSAAVSQNLFGVGPVSKVPRIRCSRHTSNNAPRAPAPAQPAVRAGSSPSRPILPVTLSQMLATPSSSKSRTCARLLETRSVLRPASMVAARISTARSSTSILALIPVPLLLCSATRVLG